MLPTCLLQVKQTFLKYCTTILVFFFSSFYFKPSLLSLKISVSFLTVFVSKASFFSLQFDFLKIYLLWKVCCLILTLLNGGIFWSRCTFFQFLSSRCDSIVHSCRTTKGKVGRRKTKGNEISEISWFCFLKKSLPTYVLFSLTGTHKNVLETKKRHRDAGKPKVQQI